MASVRGEALPLNRMAQARASFLTRGEAQPPEVREAILASWRRSREWNVRPDHIELPYVRDPDLDSSLARSAMPVLRQLGDYLDGQPVSAILIDGAGIVQSRLAADDDLERHLDDVMLATGFSYAEAAVGTNGIGTALEGGQPAQVIGPEHYAGQLGDLVSAGVPIYHPISGKLVGAVGLAGWSRDASPLLLALIKTASDQITQALLTESSAQELELLQGFLRACRHSSGIVLALNNDVVMMNDQARHVLEQGDQEVLLGYAREVLADGRTNAMQVELPTGLTARMHCRPTGSARSNGTVAGIVQVKLLEPPRMAGDAPPPARMLLPGLVGSGALWLRSSQQVQESYEAGDWLALEGEPGVGKLALARAVHQRRNPARRFDVLDAPEAGVQDWLRQVRRALLDAEGDLVIRHVDHLGPRQTHALAAVLQEARPGPRTDGPAGGGGQDHGTAKRPMWVAVTMTNPSAVLTETLRLFPITVALPPLRHHIEDLPELTQFFLGKLSQHGRLTCSPDAMKLLMRSSWPGNVEQLWQVIRRIVQRRRVGSIRPEDLPPECWTVSRRLLRPLEALERDAIVQRLLDTDGNKARAAESLGMSRATIYRKMHEYGIITQFS
jgi:sigma-54 dependent transcriptional regulator, acetoin dehydrogenase operon transcriptional activator AcoR